MVPRPIFLIALSALCASASAAAAEDRPPPTVSVLLTTGVLFEGIGEALTIRDLAVANNGTWYLEVDTVTGGNTGGGGSGQLDPVLLSNDGVVINRLDRQPGEVFFPELTGEDPVYQLTTVEEIATLNGELALFQNVQYLTPGIGGGAQFGPAASLDTDLKWIEGITFDGLAAGRGTLFASAFEDSIAVLANGNVVQGFDVFSGGERTSGIFEVNPDDGLKAVAVPFYDGLEIDGVGQVRSFTHASHEVGVSPNGRVILGLQVEDEGINSNTRIVAFDPADGSYTLLAAEDQGTLDFPAERLNDFLGSAVAINDAGDSFFRGQFRDFDPDFGSIVLVINGEVFRAGRQFIDVDGGSFPLVSTVAPQGALRYYLDPDGTLLWAGQFDDPGTAFDDVALFLGDQVLLREGVTTFDNVTFEQAQLTNGGELILDIPGGTFDGVRLVEIGAGLTGAPNFALPNDGLNASSWAMSPNGRYVIAEVGVEHPVNGERLMAAVLIDLAPAPCLADFNGDGAADANDFFAFVQAFRVGSPAADLSGDGLVTLADVLIFRRAFLLGCP